MPKWQDAIITRSLMPNLAVSDLEKYRAKISDTIRSARSIQEIIDGLGDVIKDIADIDESVNKSISVVSTVYTV